MLENGVYLAPASYEAGFVSAAHTQEIVQQTLDIADLVLADVAKNCA
jgi:glutamate-1-semialdehyde 2,1-aminomutase